MGCRIWIGRDPGDGQASGELGVENQVLTSLHVPGGYARVEQDMHGFARLALAGPVGDASVDSVMPSLPPLHRVEARIACPIGVAKSFLQRLPLRVVLDSHRAPLVLAGTCIHALGCGVPGAIAETAVVLAGGLT